jgi:nitrogen fixation protein NifU and related proteins
VFTPALIEHSVNTRNRESLPDANGRGESHYPECGDSFKLAIRVVDGRIERACFEAQACGPVVATGSLGTELITGMSVKAARQINAFQLDERLGGLPPAKRHAILLFLDSLNQATQAYA